MSRSVGWFSSGAASAVAIKLYRPDVIVYCDTGAEDSDNMRFLDDCEKWFGQEIIKIKSEKYRDTWDVWEKRRYIAGIAGAPCTGELKIKPRLAFQRPDDLHVFGYTSDGPDRRRASAMGEHWPDLRTEFPLIDRGLNKAACLDLLLRADITPPRVYAMGFSNANCIPCCKSSSPAYWALIRKEFPEKFARYAELSERLGVKQIQVKGERISLLNLADDQSTSQPLSPECDFLCQLAEQEVTDCGLKAADKGGTYYE